jgi:hypothetical protein
MASDNITNQNDSYAFMAFKDSIKEQVEALQAAGRDFLTKEREAKQSEARSGAANGTMPREIRIEIRIGPDDPKSPIRALDNDVHQMECWDHIYVCGHFLSGEPYYCSIVVCEVVEEITILPG